ncbi:hypothetical protein BDY21DRAFT_387555 [Lineolata rhizophorae]|uniref:SWIM-type domain-containing protein n=1 Tax=Lineolata rhizophorae TaxID=578093 RepID=A0A6A6NSG2_9PEZI|nr:hypothetical protein BDY21DRAFT_387555 [Lineolata rhizophorae]
MSTPDETLPTSRAFLTRLVRSLSSPGITTNPPTNIDPANANPLAHFALRDRNLLLTLHALFPHELLPALDLLDRRLVLRFCVRPRPPSATVDGSGGDQGQTEEAGTGHNGGGDRGREEAPTRDTEALQITQTYYVRSAQQPHHQLGRRHGGGSVGWTVNILDAGTTHYEVRLRAWNCSCPAFAFAAYPAAANASGDVDGEERLKGDEDNGWEFGGATKGEDMPPACKHILACVLVERCPLFAEFVEHKEVCIEEAAGWAAGWGG